MIWIGDRISCSDEKTYSTIVIYPEKTGWKNSLLLAWFSMWMLIGAYVIYELTQGYTKEFKLMLVVFLSFWLYFAFKVGKATFWQFYGKELIRIDTIALMYKRSVFQFGKASPFLLDNIQKLRVDETKESNLGVQFENSIWVVGGEKLSFDNLGKTYRFGRKLSKQDATLLFKYISKRLDMYIKKAKKND
jgi:hypothetical protein